MSLLPAKPGEQKREEDAESETDENAQHQKPPVVPLRYSSYSTKPRMAAQTIIAPP
jgi:hypothetical protein